MNWLDDPEDAEREDRARMAGYRGPLVKISVRKAQAIDLKAPPGAYPIDALAQKIEAKRIRGGEHCTDDLWGMAEPECGYQIVRAMIADNDEIGAAWSKFRLASRDQAPRDAAAVASKLDSIVADIQAFIEHSPDDAVAAPSHNQPSFDATRDALQTALSRLKELKSARQEFERRNSREDLEKDTFLLRMSLSYSSLIGKAPGKTTAGLFLEFCVLVWKTYGWPGTDDGIRDSLKHRIGRGVHLDVSKPY